MHLTIRTSSAGRLVLYGLAAAGLLLARPVRAQDDGYRVGENRPAPPPPARSQTASPRRLARVDYVTGKVTWRTDDSAKWGKVETNQALKAGAEMWAEDGARAEVRFDDGSILRLGSNSVVTLQTVYVDADGEYTQIKMLSGIATLLPREERSVFEVNTPFVSVKTTGPSRLRIGVGDDVEVAVSRGRANLEGKQGKITLNAGDFISQRASDTDYAVRSLPSPDSWERWNDERDRKLAAEAHPPYHEPSLSRTYTSIFLSLGFPVYRSYEPSGRYHEGRGVYRHRR